MTEVLFLYTETRQCSKSKPILSRFNYKLNYYFLPFIPFSFFFALQFNALMYLYGGELPQCPDVPTVNICKYGACTDFQPFFDMQMLSFP